MTLFGKIHQAFNWIAGKSGSGNDVGSNVDAPTEGGDSWTQGETKQNDTMLDSWNQPDSLYSYSLVRLLEFNTYASIIYGVFKLLGGGDAGASGAGSFLYSQLNFDMYKKKDGSPGGGGGSSSDSILIWGVVGIGALLVWFFYSDDK